MRAHWTERHERPGWDVFYTPVGGVTNESVLDGLEPEFAQQASRALSQAFVASSNSEHEAGDDVRFWATVCRKIIQRGSNPVMRHALIEELAEPELSNEEYWSAVNGLPGVTTVDAAFDLHEVHETPFWNRLTEADPRLARWLYPQAPLEVLAGTDDDATSRWVDFVVTFPWDPRSAVVEIDGVGHERSAGVDRVRDALLAAAEIPVVRIPGRQVHVSGSREIERIESAVPDWYETPELEHLRWIHTPAAINRLAFALVHAVEAGFLSPATSWAVEVEDDTDMLGGCEAAALDLISAIGDVWNLPIVPDQITINGRIWAREPSRRFLEVGEDDDWDSNG